METVVPPEALGVLAAYRQGCANQLICRQMLTDLIAGVTRPAALRHLLACAITTRNPDVIRAFESLARSEV